MLLTKGVHEACTEGQITSLILEAVEFNKSRFKSPHTVTFGELTVWIYKEKKDAHTLITLLLPTEY